MHGITMTAAVAGVASLLGMSTARATDQLLPGTRLSLKVSSTGKEKLSFKSKAATSFMIPTPGSGDDPSVNASGASLQISNPTTTSNTFTFNLPKAHWTVNSSGTIYKYRDPFLTESGKVKIALIGGKSLKVSGKKVGITLTGTQGSLDAVLTSGSFRYCAHFGGEITRDETGVFNARNAPPPSSCPGAAPTTSTTTTSTTTSTSTTSGVTTTTMACTPTSCTNCCGFS